MMEVNAESGDVVQKWSAQEKLEEGGDKMSSALKKLDEAKKRRVNLFDQKKDELKDKKKRIENAFKNEVERVKKEGVKENPFKPFDLD
jgi:ElaB/YqjD/DUF883 family membrane-anchored ribosome-binding protein